EEFGTGPCVQAVILDEVVVTDDVTADPRWEVLHDALRDSGVRAVAGVPIHVGGSGVGSLNRSRDRPGDWTAGAVDGLVACGRLIERLLLSAMRADRHERTVEQLEHALAHRVTIDRAVGMLMARERLDAVSAFERLRSLSRSTR